MVEMRRIDTPPLDCQEEANLGLRILTFDNRVQHSSNVIYDSVEEKLSFATQSGRCLQAFEKQTASRRSAQA
jgi:hypothetical protein